MSFAFNKKQEQLHQSAIRYMSAACTKVDGINMAQGICDLDVPVAITEGAIQAIHEGNNIYTAADGTSELREAIAAKYASHYGLEVDPEDEVLVSAGTTGALYAVLLGILEPGDEVILFEPYYGYHKSTLESLDCKIKYVSITLANQAIDFAGLRKALTPRTKMIILNNPLNPSGKVFSFAELEKIGNLLDGSKTVVVADEIYEHFVYGGRRHVPVSTVDSLKKRSLIVSGFSKIFSITGWRVGYAVLPVEVKRAAVKFNDLVYVCPPAPLQKGVANGLHSLGMEYYENVAIDLEKKRDLFCTVLMKKGLKPVVPEGAYYVMADISSLPGATDRDKVLSLLEKTGVASVPGSAFFHTRSGIDMARFCFAKKMDVLQEACRRIEQGL